MLILDRQTRPAGRRRLITSLAHSEAEFNTVDLLVFLPLSRMNDRYAKHFLKTSKHFLEMQPDKPCSDGQQLLKQPHKRSA